ncbi:VTT domain-containing protein [Brevibacillus choshinensis]|uniref:DedA family protein n=1 Tax=Brevibacillus choshinensis TaxID=54911 RepID=UPI002E209F64|nr:VTT domain-containing protein [Brevibacillus choshinensis]
MELHSFFGLFVSYGKEMTSKLIPDEIVVMTAGAQAAHSDLYIGKTFIAVYLAMLLVLTSCYFLGAIVGARFGTWINQRRGIPLDKGRSKEGLKHGGWMLCLSLFIPGARYLVPFLAGVYRFRLPYYLLVLLPSSLVWTLHYFLAGYWFSDKMEWLEAGVYSYSKIAVTGMIIIGVAYTVIRQLRRMGNRFH